MAAAGRERQSLTDEKEALETRWLELAERREELEREGA
jgi:hypothetical protein